jgi:phosphatidylglycerophosphate synthase
MKDTIKAYYLELKNGIKTMFKEFFNKETNKKQRANMWTFSRLIISIPILILSIIYLINFSIPLLITNTILVGMGSITDYFDGKSARKYNSSSEFGKKLDQIVADLEGAF